MKPTKREVVCYQIRDMLAHMHEDRLEFGVFIGDGYAFFELLNNLLELLEGEHD